MKVLNSNELNQVSGGWVANALGAAAGAYGAGYGYLAGGGKDPNKFLGAVALGGLTGAVSPVNGIRSAAKTAAVSFGGSAATTAIGSPYF
ncbi:bacteriocin [Neisseria weixii]|uniref:Bacteriocin n=1 Tax=Neisseria weixii TaxID=1853276 RepID=A0A3N4MWJ0_9NEIS|nr:bacteriocin [Neisseria weixii]ATD65087.1 hypothetical protein CGZ65_06730 [Neisseria weixii]RPD83559.1 bacteriocin [Neisseria weixii]RPD83935.1 bacteriocin [Neisseria weixii]